MNRMQVSYDARPEYKVRRSLLILWVVCLNGLAWGLWYIAGDLKDPNGMTMYPNISIVVPTVVSLLSIPAGWLFGYKFGWEPLFLGKYYFSKKQIDQTPIESKDTPTQLVDRSNLRSPAGLGEVISAGDEQKPLPQSTDTIEVVEPSEKQAIFLCGHTGPEVYAISTYGEISIRRKQDKHCPECLISELGAVVIRCALCGLPIFPGGGIALYAPGSGGLRMDIATVVGESVIGCMRWDCCPSGAFFAGNWTVDGFKSYFDNGQTAADKCFSTGEMVIGNT